MKNKCMHGYIMNSNGSCVPIKRTNTKQRGLPNFTGRITSRNRNRAVLPCCFQECEDTQYMRASCGPTGQVEIDVYHNWTIGGTMGCDLVSYSMQTLRSSALYKFLRGLTFMHPGTPDKAYCNNGILYVADSQIMCENHPFGDLAGTCVFPHHGTETSCAGYYTPVYQGISTPDGGYMLWDPYDDDAPYLCGNWQPYYPGGNKEVNPFVRGGSIKRNSRKKR
jgi:hypothetical protein